MQQLQDDFYSTVSSKYGLERGSRADLESGGHSRKHLETAEYKEKLARDRTKQAEQVISKAKSEAEKIISDAKAKSEKELEEFHRYKRWAKKALDEYVEQSDRKDEMTKQADQGRKALTDLQEQILSAEQKIEKLKREIDSFNKTLEQLTQNQDDRYCSFRIESSLLFAKLMETAQEYNVAVRMEKSADGTTIVKAPVSEKKYLALAIEKAKKLLPPKPEHQEQTQVVQPPRRRGPHL